MDRVGNRGENVGKKPQAGVGPRLPVTSLSVYPRLYKSANAQGLFKAETCDRCASDRLNIKQQISLFVIYKVLGKDVCLVKILKSIIVMIEIFC